MTPFPTRPKLDHPFGDDRPEATDIRQVAEGLYWVRFAIPIPGLNYINLWLIDDGDDGWAMVDTGIRSKDIRLWWEDVLTTKLDGRPLSRIFCTHFHPDHLGQAGGLRKRWGCDLWMTLGEWAFGRMLVLDQEDHVPDDVLEHYRKIGYSQEMLDTVVEQGYSNMSRAMTKIPRAFRRITHQDRIKIGAHEWQVIVGRGHSPEHACLYSPDQGILISGDQILPSITPHIGVYPAEPDANPLQLYIDSLDRFRHLPDDTLVLPAHGDPFRGLHARLDYLGDHHHARLAALWAFADRPMTIMELLPSIFIRKLRKSDIPMAMSEAISHIHMLIGQGRMVRTVGDDGVYRYAATGSAPEYAGQAAA